MEAGAGREAVVPVAAALAVAVPEDRTNAASAAMSGRKKFAGSASTASITSITRKPTCCSRSCRSAEKFCRAA